MANPSKRKGSSWEQAIVDFLREHKWVLAERRALAGKNDRGDVAGVPGWVIEAKAAKSMALGSWWSETLAEQANDGAEFAVMWVKRTGKTSAGDGWVVMSGEMFVKMLAALDDGR